MVVPPGQVTGDYWAREPPHPTNRTHIMDFPPFDLRRLALLAVILAALPSCRSTAVLQRAEGEPLDFVPYEVAFTGSGVLLALIVLTGLRQWRKRVLEAEGSETPAPPNE